MEIPILRELLVLMVTSVGVVYAFQRLKLPPISGFLLSGILLGPGGFGLVGNVHEVEVIAEIGVALLLFTIGLEFSLERLRQILALVMGAGGLQVLTTIGAITGLALWMGRPLPESIFLGFLLALSSTAIVLKIVGDRGELDAPHGQVMVAILIFQDLAVVPLMLLTPVLSGQGGSALDIALAMGKSFALVAAILLSATFLIPRILARVVQVRSREVFVLTTIMIALGTAWLTGQAGLSLALGAFLAGIAISKSEYSHQTLTEVLPFRDATSSLFFISVGMLVRPADWLAAPLETAGLFLGVLLVKAILVGNAAMLFGYGTRVAVLAGLGLAQVGEFAFILAKFGAGYQLLPEETYQTFLSVSVLTMLFTPFAFLLSPVLAGAAQTRISFLENLVPRLAKLSPNQASAPKEGHKLREGHVIVVGYGLNGRNVSRVLREAKIDYAILELNPVTVSTMRAKGEPIFYGDATRAEVLHHLGIEKARVLVLVIADPASSRQIVAVAKGLNPKLDIIVRTRYMSEIDGLYRLGATEVVPEELETSLEILGRVLRSYGVEEETIHQEQETIRRERYGLLLGRRPPASAQALQALLGGQALTSVQLTEGCPAIGQTLAALDLRKRGGASVLAIHRAGQAEVQPDPSTPLRESDVLVLLGTPQQVTATGLLLRGLSVEAKAGE